MKRKLICTIIFMLSMTLMLCACMSKSEKLVQQGYEQMEKANYEEALKYYSDAVIEDPENGEAEEVKKILECYLGALGAADILDTKAAREYMREMPENYVNYPIKDDVNALKKEIGSSGSDSSDSRNTPEPSDNPDKGSEADVQTDVGDVDTSRQDDPGAAADDIYHNVDPNESNLNGLETVIDSKAYKAAQATIDHMDTSTMTEAQKQRFNELCERLERERANEQPVG